MSEPSTSSALDEMLEPSEQHFFKMTEEKQKQFKSKNPSVVDMWELAESLSHLPLGFRRYLYDINHWHSSILQRKCLIGAPKKEKLANRGIPADFDDKMTNLCVARLHYISLPVKERLQWEYLEFCEVLRKKKKRKSVSLQKVTEFPLSLLLNINAVGIFLRKQMLSLPLILCTHCDDSPQSFGSIREFHDHFKQHGVLTAYGCHRCLHLFHTREMWEQHRKSVCTEKTTDAALSSSLWAAVCVGCGFTFIYNPIVSDGAVASKQLGDLMRIQNCHNCEEMVMFRLVTTEKEEDPPSDIRPKPRKWTGATFLPKEHATCKNRCRIGECNEKFSSFSEHIVHTEKHCKKHNVRFQFVNFLNELVGLNPFVKSELKWRRHRLDLPHHSKNKPKRNTAVVEEKRMPDGVLNPFSVILDPNAPLPGIARTSDRVLMCKRCKTLTIGSKSSLTHVRACYQDQTVTAEKIAYSNKFTASIYEFNHLPNESGQCGMIGCGYRACSIQGFVIHMLTEHGVQVVQDSSALEKYDETYREDYDLSRPSLKTMEINQKCFLTFDGHFLMKEGGRSKADYTMEELFYKEDGLAENTCVTVQEVEEDDEELIIDKVVYKSKEIPVQASTLKEPENAADHSSLAFPPLSNGMILGDSTVIDSGPVDRKKRSNEDRKKRKKDKKLVVNIEAMPRLETSEQSDQIRAQKAERDEALRKHQEDPIPYDYSMVCFDCGLISKDGPSLLLHLKTHGCYATTSNTIQIVCNFCEQKLDNMNVYYEHVYRTHSKPNFDRTKNVSPICCSFCENGRSYETLLPHLRFECTYTKNCGVCRSALHDVKDGKVQLFKRSQRDKHMRDHQVRTKRFFCSCGKDFPHYILYLNHVCERKENKKIVDMKLSPKMLQNIAGPEEAVAWITKWKKERGHSEPITNENEAQAGTSKASERPTEKRSALHELISAEEPAPSPKRRRKDNTFKRPGLPSATITYADLPPPSVVCLNPPSVVCLENPDPYAVDLQNGVEHVREDEQRPGQSNSMEGDDEIIIEQAAPMNTVRPSTSVSMDDGDDDLMICEPSVPSRGKTREKNYKCSHCSMTFITMSSQKHHETREHAQDVSAKIKVVEGTYGIPVNQDLYICPICMYAFESQETHYDHMSAHNTGVMMCDYCSGTSGSRQMMTKHLSSSGHGFAAGSVDPEKDSDMTVVPIPGEFWCTECSPCLVFACDSGLFLHLATAHSEAIFFFCKKCLFGNRDVNNVLTHIATGACPGETRIYERTMGFLLAKTLHYHPENEKQHRAILVVEGNNNKYLDPSECSHRSTIRFSQRMSTCHEEHDANKKCFNPINFYNFESHLAQVNNYYAPESSALPEKFLPKRLYVEPKYNFMTWLTNRASIPTMKTSEEKWNVYQVTHTPRHDNQFPIGSNTLLFNGPNPFRAARQARKQLQQQSVGHPLPYNQSHHANVQMISQQMMMQQQMQRQQANQMQRHPMEIQQHMAQQQYIHQQQTAQPQQVVRGINPVSNQQGNAPLQALLNMAPNGWPGQNQANNVMYANAYQQMPQTSQQGQMMNGGMHQGMIPPQQSHHQMMPPQQARFVPTHQMSPEQFQSRPQQAVPPMSRQQASQPRAQAPQVQHVQQVASGPRLAHQPIVLAPHVQTAQVHQAAAGQGFGTCAICNKSIPKCLLVSLLRVQMRKNCIVSVQESAPAAVQSQEKEDIRVRLDTNGYICFKHANPWGVNVMNSEFYLQDPTYLAYVFAESFSPALNAPAYMILLNDQTDKLLRGQVDLAMFVRRLRAGTQCNMGNCQTFLKTRTEAQLHAFHSKQDDVAATTLLCTICKKEYRTTEDMLHHLFDSHVSLRRGVPIQCELACPVCGVTSPTIEYFREHLIQQHRLMSSSCNCVFVNQMARAQHEKKHHRQGVNNCCLLCGEHDIFDPFKCKTFVVTHFLLHGIDVKNVCRICFESTPTQSQLVEHCRQVHQIDMRCDLCNVNLTRDQLRDHIALRHELQLFSLKSELKVTTPPSIGELIGLTS